MSGNETASAKELKAPAQHNSLQRARLCFPLKIALSINSVKANEYQSQSVSHIQLRCILRASMYTRCNDYISNIVTLECLSNLPSSRLLTIAAFSSPPQVAAASVQADLRIACVAVDRALKQIV